MVEPAKHGQCPQFKKQKMPHCLQHIPTFPSHISESQVYVIYVYTLIRYLPSLWQASMCTWGPSIQNLRPIVFFLAHIRYSNGLGDLISMGCCLSFFPWHCDKTPKQRQFKGCIGSCFCLLFCLFFGLGGICCCCFACLLSMWFKLGSSGEREHKKCLCHTDL